MVLHLLFLIINQLKKFNKVCGIFLLKFSTEMMIRTMNGTLTHNVLRICEVRIEEPLKLNTNLNIVFHIYAVSNM
jgi:hypothetical protein